MPRALGVLFAGDYNTHTQVLVHISPCCFRYKPGDIDAEEWATSSFFRAPPLSILSPSDAKTSSSTTNGWHWGTEVVKVGVFGDMGTAEADGSQDAGHSEELPSLKTTSILEKKLGIGVLTGKEAPATEVGGLVTPNLELVVHIGDLSYARGYDAQWDEVGRV